MIHSSENGFASRRSTRVSTDVLVELQGEGFAYAGQTVTVNLHGALIHVYAPLKLEDRIILHVHLTGKSAAAKVVFIDAGEDQFGIELDTPGNIWGVAMPPSDWNLRPSDVPVAQE